MKERGTYKPKQENIDKLKAFLNKIENTNDNDVRTQRDEKRYNR